MASALTKISVPSVTLPAGVETDVLGASGIDVTPFDYLEIQLVNLSGTNSISGAKAYKSQDGTHWDEITSAALTTIAASGSATMIFVQKAMGTGRLRVTATSTAGASVSAKGDGGVTSR